MCIFYFHFSFFSVSMCMMMYVVDDILDQFTVKKS